MYLLIDEAFDIFKIEKIDDLLKSQAVDGYVDIIDISDPENPKDYYNEQWNEIQSYS